MLWQYDVPSKKKYLLELLVRIILTFDKFLLQGKYLNQGSFGCISSRIQLLLRHSKVDRT
jgi:hypothetical protein